MGICNGKHMMVKALGEIKRNLDNKEHDSQEQYVHSIKINKDLKFYKIIGKEEIMVNSRHIGYSSDLEIFKAIAYSPDGIDEVVEDSNK